MVLSTSATCQPLVVETPGARLAVCDYAGRSEPVVLLHGGPGCPDYLGPVAASLALGHRAVTFDQRGVGRSAALNGRFGVSDYLGDLEAIRARLGIDRWHVFGHSWGGLLAQLYARAHPDRVRSLFLCSASLGVGADWERTQQAAVRYNRRQAGSLGMLALGLWSLLLPLPNPVGHWATERLFRVVWRNYFRDPRRAPPADERWLAGVNGRAMSATARTVRRTGAEALPDARSSGAWPVLVLYGEHDIYGDGVEVVFARFPAARHIILGGSGHLPWLQAPEAFAEVLRQFYPMAAPTAHDD